MDSMQVLSNELRIDTPLYKITMVLCQEIGQVKSKQNPFSLLNTLHLIDFGNDDSVLWDPHLGI